MSDKIWHGLLIFVLVGKTVEFSYRFYKWYKNKKNKNSEK
nr:MAG TPA: Ribosome associated membrane protein RAMP4 [Caudoviricetes sp.]